MQTVQDRARKILQRGIDLHAHTGPSLFPRVVDSIEAAQQAASYGMRGIVLKNHHSMTPDRAALVNRIVPNTTAYGGIVLNRYVGGINPYAVEAAIDLGARIIWMPTQWAQHHITVYGAPEYHHMKRATYKEASSVPTSGISILKEDGNLTTETHQILEIIADAGVALATAHLSKAEILKLVSTAKMVGINRVIITHITLSELWTWTVEEQRELIRNGALIEHVAIYCMENRYLISPKEVAALIDAVGYENVVISSDCGQMKNPPPAEALHLFLTMLLEAGMEAKQLEYMIRINPARVLGLN